MCSRVGGNQEGKEASTNPPKKRGLLQLLERQERVTTPPPTTPATQIRMLESAGLPIQEGCFRTDPAQDQNGQSVSIEVRVVASVGSENRFSRKIPCTFRNFP